MTPEQEVEHAKATELAVRLLQGLQVALTALTALVVQLLEERDGGSE